ncbi:Retrovirus-related Pol polyprotein from transposon 297 [Eumeta japonica]|uniref:RNA-directed DNA polymerase n=1 Tax=Eumeta variegata TaxID=151549 RepID=A0A4C1T0L4_EUMVA|nr:Retrovirus-related Pol polyprotein from transposon 297 [Eumeta japonica]
MAVVYMDDVIIPSRDEEEGIERLKMVLSVAEENGLRVRWKKCQFLQRKVNFLGYIIEKGTIRPSKDKTIAIENFPLPHDKKSLQRFLGLTSYFRRFVEGYATIAKPLSDLLRKENKFELKEEALSAFQQLKLVLMKDPVLKLFNVNAITEVHTDASKFGYGAVLMQKDSEDQALHPVQYMSRKTSPAEEKIPPYELEVLV